MDSLLLKSQKRIFKALESGSTSIDRLVFNESAKPSEFNGVNKVFTFNFPFQLGTSQVYYGTTRQPLGEAYTEASDGLSITFTGDAPDPLTAVLFWDYIKA